MSATYYLILTEYGAQRIAQLQADQSSAALAVNFVAGDANGNPYLPQTRIAATALLNQRVSVPLQSVDVVDDDTCQAVAVLDATVGGFNIHEIGITDGTGQLIYIGNYHGGYKPVLSEGAGGDLTVVLDLVASGIGTVIISPDPSFIYAGQNWVDANFVRIPTFTAHVAQNTIEHNNLANLITTLNQRIANLEQREEIQIGEFIVTDDPRNPSVYKGYGDWRLVPDVLLKGLDSGGTVGQFSQVAAGSDQSVRATFFWQRFDPNEVMPLRTAYISSDSTDVNLLDLFTATYGAPVIGERAHFVIESGVLVTATTTSNYAVITGDWPTSSVLTMDVLGIASGRGGNGNLGSSTDGLNGRNGGGAIAATHPLLVNNFNIVAGGGGGGAGVKVQSGGGVDSVIEGGGGAPYGDKGNGFDSFSYTAGQDGGRLIGGDGAVNPRWTVTGGGFATGGKGGDIGAAGQAANSPPYEGGNGGLAGIAITGPVTVTGNPVLGR